ncbi:MAG: hypothetical protein KAW45_02130 [Thermoplasmatales archaeon]|nr:hypothetical protein [Thermoplasmatales archaeon]
MGHERIDTTEDYVKFAKHYYRNAPYDWIHAVLKFYKTNPEFLEQQNGTSKIEKQVGKKQGVSVRSFSCWSECSHRELALTGINPQA